MAKKSYYSRKTIPFNFGDKHIEYIRKCQSNIYNIAEGAVRAGKTVDNVFAFAHELETTPDKIHLATGSTSANAKLNIGDANGFGLESIFRGQSHWGKYKGNDCLYIKGPKTQFKQKIVIFAGASLANSFKKIRGNSYGMWIATEINLHHDNTIKEAFNRTLASKRRKFFWDLNPDHPRAKIYVDYIDKYVERAAKGELSGGVNYQHFTIFDNVNISDESRNEFISQYEKGTIWYQRDILGIRCVATGLVYPMFSRQKHVVSGEFSYNPRHRYYVSVDYGTVNPFAAGLYDYSPLEKKATMIKELYFRGGSKNRVDNEAYYRMLKSLIGDFRIEYIIIDPSAASMIETIQKYGEYSVIGGNNDVLNGIQDVTKYLNSGALFFCATCTNTFDEFEAYVWDEKSEEDRVVKENDHSMDQIRYFCRTALRNELKWIV